MIGFVRRNAAIAGRVKASVPENGRYAPCTGARAIDNKAENNENQKRYRPRRCRKDILCKLPEFDVAGNRHQAKPPRISSDRSVFAGSPSRVCQGTQVERGVQRKTFVFPALTGEVDPVFCGHGFKTADQVLVDMGAKEPHVQPFCCRHHENCIHAFCHFTEQHFRIKVPERGKKIDTQPVGDCLHSLCLVG